MNNPTAATVSRVIGRVDGAHAGPVVIALGGIHGNEPSGVKALQNVLDKIEPQKEVYNGRFLALRGNVAALSQQKRFIDEDMNRIWFPEIIQEIREQPEHQIQSSERREIKNIIGLMDKFIPSPPKHPVIFADLHSFSAQGGMFAITARKRSHISLFSRLHVPLIFGIENSLRGTALRYYQDQGLVTFALEGGQHSGDQTVSNTTAAMLSMLDEIGCLGAESIDVFEDEEAYLAEQNKRLPARVELIYQHVIKPGDTFKMRPGYRNFQPVQEGEWLANDQHGKIRCKCDGYMLMPLYQQQGEDGFFIVKDEDH